MEGPWKAWVPSAEHGSVCSWEHKREGGFFLSHIWLKRHPWPATENSFQDLKSWPVLDSAVFTWDSKWICVFREQDEQAEVCMWQCGHQREGGLEDESLEFCMIKCSASIRYKVYNSNYQAHVSLVTCMHIHLASDGGSPSFEGDCQSLWLPDDQLTATTSLLPRSLWILSSGLSKPPQKREDLTGVLQDPQPSSPRWQTCSAQEEHLLQLTALLSPTQGCWKCLHEWASLWDLVPKGILVDMSVQLLCKSSMGSQECKSFVKILQQGGKTLSENHPGMDLAALRHNPAKQNRRESYSFLEGPKVFCIRSSKLTA